MNENINKPESRVVIPFTIVYIWNDIQNAKIPPPLKNDTWCKSNSIVFNA